MSAGKSFIAPLHGLRGLLAVWVLLSHTVGATASVLGIIRYGYLAVDMFFMMSGFVLMQSHQAEFRNPALGSFVRFTRLRWWRTYPLWLACFAVSFPLFIMAVGRLPAPGEAFASLFLLDGWAMTGMRIFPPAWSLGAEWVGYLAFPLVAAGVLRMSAPAGIGLMAGLMAFVAWQVDSREAIGIVSALVRMGCGFVAGCVLWRVHALRPAAGTGRHDAGLVTAALGAILLCWFFPTYFCAPALLLMVHFVARGGPWTSLVLGAAAAQFLGRISFALYLSHYPIPRFVQGLQGADASLGRRMAFTLLALLAALALAYVLCRWVEEPMRRFGRARVLGTA